MGRDTSGAKHCRWEQCCRVRLVLPKRIHHTPYPVSMGFGHHAPNKYGHQIPAQASSHSQTKHSIPAKHSVICLVELQFSNSVIVAFTTLTHGCSVNKMIYIFAHYIYICIHVYTFVCICYTFLYFFYSYMAYNMNNDNGCVSGAP